MSKRCFQSDDPQMGRTLSDPLAPEYRAARIDPTPPVESVSANRPKLSGDLLTAETGHLNLSDSVQTLAACAADRQLEAPEDAAK